MALLRPHLLHHNFYWPNQEEELMLQIARHLNTKYRQLRMSHVGLILGALGLILASYLWRVLIFLTWRPFLITKSYKERGVSGPGYKFYSGNLGEIKNLKKDAKYIEMDIHCHDITPRVLPHYFKWISQYGGEFLYWFGPEARICITDAEMAKQVLSSKFGFFAKTRPQPGVLALLGKGLVLTEGAEWARHRRVVSPAFTMDKLKVMTKKMAECTLPMLESWTAQITQAEKSKNTQHNAIEVNRQFQELTADVIAHTAFGSSYIGGKLVFLAQKELVKLVLTTIFNVPVPIFSYIPTKKNIQKWKLEKKIRDTLLSIIKSRLNSEVSGYGDDLLGLLMESAQKKEGMGMNTDEIIDECKTFFFAGHETTSHLLTWTMFLLSTHIEWQEELRREVVAECGMEIPNADSISKLKLVTMVLLETLRLYGPALMLTRQATTDMNLGRLKIPKGITVTIPIAIIHRKKDIWGDDADEFNPLRFKDGIAKAAKHANALLAFSIGPRACIGQNFAMMEAKTVIAMILQRFSFSLSPDYKHMPADMLTLQPQHGLPIIFKPLDV